MRYRKLGNTGLIVSSVALGTMQFGGKMNMGNLNQADTTRMVKLALDRGINFIDTADVYSLGESETLVGNALKGMRNEIVLATKVRLPIQWQGQQHGECGKGNLQCAQPACRHGRRRMRQHQQVGRKGNRTAQCEHLAQSKT